MREVITPHRHSIQCCFGDGKGGRVAGKIFLIFTMSKFLRFYPPMVCLNLPLGSWTSVSFLFSFLCRSGGIEQLCCSAFPIADIKICLPIAICTHGQDSFWVPWHVVHTDIFVCGWMSNSLLNRGTDGQLSYATWCWYYVPNVTDLNYQQSQVFRQGIYIIQNSKYRTIDGSANEWIIIYKTQDIYIILKVFV